MKVLFTFAQSDYTGASRMGHSFMQALRKCGHNVIAVIGPFSHEGERRLGDVLEETDFEYIEMIHKIGRALITCEIEVTDGISIYGSNCPEWLLVFFYPKDDTPGCTKEACSLRDNFTEIKKLNANVVGISIDSSDSHKKFKEKYSLPFMLLSDPDGETAKKYGALNNFFIFKLAKRQSFIIDPDGVIRRVYRNVSPSNHAQEIKSDLEAFKRNS